MPVFYGVVLLSLILALSFCCALVAVASANEYALKGLDKMEEKLPILHQPADKVRIF